MDNQKRWNRYCKAINYCMKCGYFIKPIDSKGGNVKSIQVGYWNDNDNGSYTTTIPLKPKKYTGEELFSIIRDAMGYNPKEYHI